LSGLLDSLAGAVAAARRLGASDVEVSHAARTLGMARFANSTITQSGVVDERLTRVRVAVGEQIGAATTSGLDAGALEDAAAQALEAARMSPASHGFAGFARPDGATTAPPAFAPATAALGAGERADVLGGLFRRAARDHLLLAGSYQTGPRTRAVVTAAGVARSHTTTEAQLSVIALDGDVSGYAVGFAPDASRLDPAGLAEEACTTAVRARGPIEIDPGAYDVVLAPAAVAELVEWLAIGSFSARAVLDGTSFLAGPPGAPLCDERVSLVDDSSYHHADVASVPFDAEGTARRRVLLVDQGRAGTPVSDLAAAARLGGPSTGHAPPLGPELSDGPMPSDLILLPGADAPADLIKRVERGLYVTRFHYVNGLLDTRRAVMTGMTRDGLFQIHDGAIGKAVTNLRFTESILDALGRLGGLGTNLKAIPANWTMTPTLCPTILLRDFHFTGRSR